MILEWINELSSCRLFKGIAPEELTAMLECLKPRISAYKKGELIAIAGDQLTGVGIVLSGDVAVTKENLAGKIMMAKLGQNDLFGEIAAFSGAGVWPATVVAERDCKVLFLPPEKLAGNCKNECAGHKLLIMNMLGVLSDKALALNKKVDYISIKNIRSKISTYLLEQYMSTGTKIFVLPLKRNEMADFLNISRPSLSREMGRMRDEGLIDFYRSSVKIRDLQVLKAMTE
jgi:CRP-like cAMP-binding protein